MPNTTKDPVPKDPAQKKPVAVLAGHARGNSELRNFFIDGLKDIYWAEQQLITTLPKMQRAATTSELKLAIDQHTRQTSGHVKRLEEVFKICSITPEAKKCEAMAGLIKEGDSILEETEEGTMTRDAAIIAAAQKVEHYEIATYGTLVEFAKTLGLNDARGLLELTLDEEKLANMGLNIIATSGINWEAEEESAATKSEAPVLK